MSEPMRNTDEAILDPDLRICDPHIHIMNSLGFNYQLEDHLKDTSDGHKVVSSIYVEASDNYRKDGPEHLRAVGEVEFAYDINQKTRDNPATRVCEAIVGAVDLTSGPLAVEALDAQMEAGGSAYKGIRADQAWDDTGSLWTLHKRGPETYNLPAFREGMAEFAKRGLALDTWQYFPQLPVVADLAKAFPDTQMVVDHVGGVAGIGAYANRREEIFEVWRGHIRSLAQYPNVWMKLGGLGMSICGFDFAQRQSPASSVEIAAAWRPYIETCIEAFGPSRCMFESNFPIDWEGCSYRTLWNVFKRIVSGASAEEKRQLFYDSAARFYSLEKRD